MILALVLMSSTLESQKPTDLFVVGNGSVSLSISRSTGHFDITFGESASVTGAYGEVRLSDGKVKRTTDYVRHDIESRRIRDVFGEGTSITVRHRSPGEPELRQTFEIHGRSSEAIVRLDLIGSAEMGSNQLVPVVGVSRLGSASGTSLNCLFVPYDNDNYFRYRSDGWDEPDGSYEVGAVYDEATRRGLVIGSIDHDQWKSAIAFRRDGRLRVVAGVTGKYTHDQEAHGTVRGKLVRSPRFVIGHYSDWRAGLERFGDLNARVSPPLAWKGDVPFGWNSWSGHKDKVNNEHADKALEFIRDDLPWLRSGGTAYVNFDSFWDNLTRDQRVAFVKKAHASGLKAGIYWTPFVNWGEPDWKVLDKYQYRDLQMKNSKGELLPKFSGGWPLDPTHPGTLERIDQNLKEFIDQGFDYIKLDFLTHGALEGKHHDPKVATGTEAYRIGMQRVVDGLSRKKAGRPIFISLSIAPMFPHGYGHSRRISCDVFSNIGASEYFLNSQNYGWWTARRLYEFNDPDSACVFQALGEDSTTEAEARTRFTASVIGGGMMIEGDDLTNPAARERVLKIFSNREALELAQTTPQFRPVRGDTGDKAGNAFICEKSDDVAYVAAFNFDKANAKKLSLNLNRLGLATGKWTAYDIWTKESRSVSTDLEISLPPTDCVLWRLTRSR